MAARKSRLPARRAVRWETAFRSISARYPPQPFFERVAPVEDFDALLRLERLTNPEFRSVLGDLEALPRAERRTGRGASPVMSAFTHYGRAGRFNTENFGVYYCANNLEAAAWEWAHHMGREYRASGVREGATANARIYGGGIDGRLCDVRNRSEYHLPNDYRPGQALALELRQRGYDGVLYRSVRYPGGLCVAALRAPVVASVTEIARLQFSFDGKTMASFFNHETEQRFLPTARMLALVIDVPVMDPTSPAPRSRAPV